MEQTMALLAIGFLAGKLLEMVKYLRAKDWNAALTLLTLWVVGVVVVFFAANTTLTEGVVLPQTTIPLGSLNGVSLFFLGLILTSLISVVYDFKKAIDGGDSAKQPPLVTDTSAGPL